MRETNREQIRRALDECLSGMDGRPSLEKRVLARAKGERRGPRRLSLALAVALLMLLLAAAALAAGVLTGWLRLRQEDVGALHGCVSLDGTLYLSTSGGLRTWKPGQEESTLLVSMDELQAQGIGFFTLGQFLPPGGLFAHSAFVQVMHRFVQLAALLLQPLGAVLGGVIILQQLTVGGVLR